VLEGQTLTELNPLLLAASEQYRYFTEEVLEQIRQQGTLAGIKQIPPTVRDVFATALEIEPRQHLRIQAAFQTAVGNAVSKTVNLPTESTPAQVAEIYREAHSLGLKGITIYRYGSREQQVLHLGVGEEPYEKEHAAKCDPYQCRL
jgi:ribonucleoside-diphosphate reductase alpha chain